MMDKNRIKSVIEINQLCPSNRYNNNENINKEIYMKTSTKLSIAIALTLILSLVGLTVWAAPLRQATVPTTPDIIPITGLIPVTGGTYQVTLLGDCGAEGTITRIADPEKEIGPANTGFEFLTDGVKVELDKACDVEICYPYPTEYKDKDGDIFKWDPTAKVWVVMESKVSGDPAQICVIDKAIKEGVYSLMGKK